MAVKLKPGEGAVNVNGDMTPITRQPIQQIERHRWHEMSVEQLFEQKQILSNRLMYAMRSQTPVIQQQLQAGINELDMIMSKFLDDSVSLL